LAQIAVIENWNGEPVAVRRSRGDVLTFERWEDNVLGAPPWPEALLGKALTQLICDPSLLF